MASDEGSKDYVPTTAGAQLGDDGDEVARLQAYLSRFGYLRSDETAGFGPALASTRAPKAEPSRFDNATYTALRRFQQFTGLPVTGELDDATLALMNQPRCGFPDLPRGNQPAIARVAGATVESFVLQGNRWNTLNLTYHFQNFTADLTEAQTRGAIQAALRLWSQATPLTFTETASANADMIIRFVAGDHGDGFPFDGPNGVLAHGFFPPPNGGAIAGDLHFDEAETWSVSIPVPAGAFDLVSVAAHEFGHTLGLNHSTIAGALMYPYYSGPHRYLSADDVLGIQTLYGARVRPVPGWFGAEDQGADITVTDINGNGRPDLVVFHIDNPGGENHGYYRIGCDLDAYGNVTAGWTGVKPVPGWFGAEDQGAGIAAADINGNGRPDLVVFHVDNPAGDNHGYYRVGFNLNTSGDVTGGWSPIMPVPGWFGWENQGSAIAIADVSRNGRPDLIVFHLDNPAGDNHGYYRIGWNLNAAGQVTGGWSPVMAVPGWFGWENQGAGIAVADIDRNGTLDLLVFHVDNPGGENHGYYRIGKSLSTAGVVTGGWGAVTPTPGWFGAEDQGAGVALADIDGNGQSDLIVFHVDNPGGENHGYYRVITDL
jgi:peptidoglycan hydrolase-like protein with peptidoglycan-binding domain